MTNQEFSEEFDILYNNIMSNSAPGLDEYEKSVFLTKAQDELIKNYFNPKGNKYGEGMDNSPKRQIDFSSIIEVITLNPTTGNTSFKLPDTLNIMMILNETITVNRKTLDGTVSKVLAVLPINYLEYQRLLNKPFKRPLKNQAWRMFTTNKKMEIIVGNNDTITSYTIRYVRKPRAIILCNLINNSIEGSTTEQTCELDPILHHELLQRAVEIAKATYLGDINTQVELGKRSE